MATLPAAMRNLNISSKNINIAVFGFGRFQPPTKGHLDLIQNIIKEAEIKREIPNTVVDSYLFSSLSQNKIDQKYIDDFNAMMEKNIFCATSRNSNPIPYLNKYEIMLDYQRLGIWPNDIKIVNSLEPEYIDGSINKNFTGVISNVAAIISFLYDRYDKIFFVIGSDRYIKGSFDEFFDKGLLEIIPTIRNESVISGTMARVQALQYFFKSVYREGEELDEIYSDYGNEYLGFDSDDMLNILSPKPGQITQTNIIEFIINQIFNYTVPEKIGIKLKDMVIAWNPTENCGKWDYKWSSPDSWDAYWRRGREYYPTRARAKSDQLLLEKDQSLVDLKLSQKDFTNKKLERAAKNISLGVMPEYHPENSGNWTDRYKNYLLQKKMQSEAYVKDLRKKKYELGKKRTIPADFGMKNILIRTNEDVVVDLAKDKIAVWTYGRFQPPHIQHDNLIDSVVDIANYLPMKNVDAYVFTSQSSNKYNDESLKSLLINNFKIHPMVKYLNTKEYKDMKSTYGSDRIAAQYTIAPGKGNFLKNKLNENPLPIQLKYSLLKKLHNHKYKNTIIQKPFIVNVFGEKIYSPFEAMNHLIKLGYNKLFFVIGFDREKAFSQMMKYGKEQGVNIYLVAKDRLESQVSGTKVRNYALAGDFERVKSSVLQGPQDKRLNDADIRNLIDQIQKNTFVSETVLKQVNDSEQRKKRAKELSKTRKKTNGGRRYIKTRKKRGGMQRRQHRQHRTESHPLKVLASNDMLELFRNPETREFAPNAMDRCRSDHTKNCLSTLLNARGLPNNKSEFTNQQLQIYNDIIGICKPKDIEIPWNTQSGEYMGGGRKKKSIKTKRKQKRKKRTTKKYFR